MNAKAEIRANLRFEFTMLKPLQLMLFPIKMLFDYHFPRYIFHLIKQSIQHLRNY
jgi:hypothetical protein